MVVSAANLTVDELTAFIKARLIVSGFDLSLLPTTFDPATGVPTQESLLASLRAFVLVNPGALNTWRPAATTGEDQDVYQQQEAPPLLYPSIRGLDRKGPLMVTQLNRRTFLGASAASMGGVALAGVSPAPAQAAGPADTGASLARLRRIKVPFVRVRAAARRDLTEATLAEASTLLRRGVCTAVELVRAHVDRIDEFDGVYQAFKRAHHGGGAGGGASGGPRAPDRTADHGQLDDLRRLRPGLRRHRVRPAGRRWRRHAG